MEEYLGIKTNPERDNLFDELGIKRLKESYMTETEISPQQRFAFVAKSFGSNIEHAQRLYDYASKHWLSFATPILSYGKSKNGLPISCFAEGTLVNTKNGLLPIELLNVGDEVLSDDGTYNPIEKIKSEDSQDLYELEFMGEVFVVTGNHLIQTREDGWVRVDELDLDYHNIVRLKD
jgi:hypothetical protein